GLDRSTLKVLCPEPGVASEGPLSAARAGRQGVVSFKKSERESAKPMIEKKSETEASYDLVAEDYAAEYLSELDRKPFDRDLLAEFSTALHGRGAVCDLGCGPGHITRFLKDRGLDVRGIDLSGEMIQRARRVNPDIKFEQGDMTSLRLEHDLFAGIVCFYAIIHIPREGVRQALAEMNRVLKPGGELLLALHGGEGSIRREEWYGRPVSLSVTLFDSE